MATRLRLLSRLPSHTTKPAVIVSRRAASSTSQPPPSLVKTATYASVFVLSTGLFAIYYFDCRAALHKYVVTPVIRHTLDPEVGHKLAVRVLGSGLAPRDPVGDDEVLRVEVRSHHILSRTVLCSRPLCLSCGASE